MAALRDVQYLSNKRKASRAAGTLAPSPSLEQSAAADTTDKPPDMASGMRWPAFRILSPDTRSRERMVRDRSSEFLMIKKLVVSAANELEAMIGSPPSAAAIIFATPSPSRKSFSIIGTSCCTTTEILLRCQDSCHRLYGLSPLPAIWDGNQTYASNTCSSHNSMRPLLAAATRCLLPVTDSLFCRSR